MSKEDMQGVLRSLLKSIEDGEYTPEAMDFFRDGDSQEVNLKFKKAEK